MEAEALVESFWRERERERERERKALRSFLSLRLHLVLCRLNFECKMKAGESEFS